MIPELSHFVINMFNSKRDFIKEHIKFMPGRFFHISREYLGDYFLFKPRVPDHRNWDEDAFFERVCFSDSVEGCLRASPDVGENSVFYVYVINGITGVDNDIIQEFDLVSDAKDTGEVWSLEPCHVSFLYTVERLYPKRHSDYSFSYVIGEEELTDDEEVALELKFVFEE